MAIIKSLREHAQTALKRAGLYYRLRSSVLHDLYWRFGGKRWMAVRDQEISFYGHLLAELRPGDLIFDVGANEGFKTDVFLRLGARVVAIEPDEKNQLILRDSFMKFRIARKPLVIVGKAVSDTNAVATMWIDGPGSAVNTLSPKWATALREHKERHVHGHHGLEFRQQTSVETTTLETLIAQHGRPIFIKIDVEGHELNVIRSLQSPVPYLSFEVNLPEFMSEGLQCVKLLADLAPAGMFNYAVSCEQGMALGRWLGADEFLTVVENCSEGCIEVFWKGLAGQKQPAGAAGKQSA